MHKGQLSSCNNFSFPVNKAVAMLQFLKWYVHRKKGKIGAYGKMGLSWDVTSSFIPAEASLGCGKQIHLQLEEDKKVWAG